MDINWRIRVRNKNFWLAAIPALALAVQLFADMFGVRLDFSETTGKFVAFVDAVFVLLTILGIVNDPTVATFSDSARALTYTEPYVDGGSTSAKHLAE